MNIDREFVVDGGVQLLGLKRNGFIYAGSNRTDASGQASADAAGTAHEPKWANLLNARIRQVASLGQPVSMRGETSPLLLKPAAADEAGTGSSLVKAFADALAMVREQLTRERERVDAAEKAGQERLAAAEARVAVAEARAAAGERDLRQLRDLLSRREAELSEANTKIAEARGETANAILHAEFADRDLQAAKQEIRQLRARGLLARILNRG